ncbi:MAG: hypothetical protein ACPGSO_02855 [Vicingaceae bacterium]
MSKESKEVIEEAIEVRLGDSLKFENLYRCKEKKGVFLLRGRPSKNGMVGIQRFMNASENHIVHVRNLVMFSDYVFITEEGHDNLSMVEVFNNLDSGAKDMEEAVPNYDHDEFKPSHFQLVKLFFEEIRSKINELGKEDEKEDKK